MIPVGWGVLGTGQIAETFVRDLHLVPDARLVAVATRSPGGLAHVAAAFGAVRAYASYEDLVVDPEVDVVYVATPHIAHYDNMMLCLEAGKAVLCEKPFTMNADQATAVVELARARGLFAMEAMWTRFVPLVARTRELLEAGAIGQPQLFVAQLGQSMPREESSYLFDLDNGGGLLLDATVYPVSLASYFFGEPLAAHSVAGFDASGVDDRQAIVLDWGDGRLASIVATLNSPLAPTFAIHGDAGSLHAEPLFAPSRLTIRRAEEEETIHMPPDGQGYVHQALEVIACLRARRLESSMMPLDETISVMRLLDGLRGSWGLVYPFERAHGALRR
ncbi:MAG: Gfo/Idh/MocA family oxidoreductase [Gaiellales bacterium]